MNAAEVEQPSNIIEKNALGIEYSAASTIGQRLRDAREENSISKEYVARKAKIRERYIDAIELVDWDVLPPGLNGRGLVRLYAKELGVSLPEFEGFSNLQTIQAEKQSEHLSQNNFTKKSRYQPAAEESAEIIKIVPRSEYKNVSFEDNFSNIYNSSRELTSHSVQNKLYQTKTHHAAAIVTPKISDIVGIELSAFDVNNSNVNKEIKMQINSRMISNDLNVLPLAKPVNKAITKKIEPVIEEFKIEEIINTVSADAALIPENNTAQNNIVQNISNSATEVTTPPKVKLKKVILYSLVPIAILGIIYGIYRFNIHSPKLNSQPLLTSERQLVNTNNQKKQLENSPIQMKSEVPAQIKSLAAQPIAVQPSVVLAPVAIERSAKVDILARVKLQIVADGKEIFSGYHQQGPLEFNFKDKAEILVYDASKVKLTYGSWDHGELGWNERKRKITLNARPYEE